MPAAIVIKKIRRELCMEQAEFGKKIGVSGSSVSFYENGERTPRIPVIKKIKQLAEKNGIKINMEDFFD